MEREEVVEKFSEFLNEYYLSDLLTAVNEGKKFIAVDFLLMEKFNTSLADELLENPELFLEAAEDAMQRIDIGTEETKTKVRFFNLPESKQVRVRNLRTEHIGKLIAVDGIVKRASEIRPEVSEAIFTCPDCGNKITVIQTERIVRSPIHCDCGCSHGFRLTGQKLYDARWVAIEEPFEITTGERPSEVMVFLKEDLTSPRMQTRTDPGNRIKITGILKQMPRIMKGSRSRQMEIYLDANFIESVEIEWEELEISQEDELRILELAKSPEIYNKLFNSVAPSLYGLSEVKEAIILQLFGGEVHTQKDKSRVRGDIHVLLVGDPSCLVADERVVLADGTIMKIGDMGSKHLQEIDFRVHTGMGRRAGVASAFHSYKKQPIMEIITETGKSVKGTHNQPVLIMENMRQAWKRLDEVKVGERVRVLPKIECRKKTLVETGWRDCKYYHRSWHIKIPQFVGEELAGLFGYMLADGWVEKRRVGFVVNREEADILKKIEESFKNCFDALVTTYDHPSASKKISYYQVNRTRLAKLLSFLKEKRVPNSIFQSKDSVIASFLRWLYEGDGCVFSKGRGRTSVSLKSINLELLRDVQLLLLRFGIHSRILWEDGGRLVKIKDRIITSNPSGSLMIRRSESIIKFSQNIGFASKKKNDKLMEAVEYAKSHIHRIHQSRGEKIVRIYKHLPEDVFDIEVPEYQRFVANGVVVHNTAKSVIMKVASGLIPRGRYVSGKGVTGAGLTATVVRDEEFLGGWVLEAGALVMCNRSVLCIDEFEKIDKSDQVALHEAMEQNTISIAKANIVATLPAQTAILGGGNPKFGRFDPYMPIKEQIDVPETLLSRFDLKFALRDVPDEEQDEKVAEHILRSRHFGGDDVKPEIEGDFLKKYIAYARKNAHPKLTEEAGAMLKDFFVQLRKRTAAEEAPVPITLRQYEALIRLSESSAKIQLRPTVTKEDALRAINLMKASLRQFGFEPETGKIDIDRAEGHTSAAQRSKIRTVLDLIEELTISFGKNIPLDELVKRGRAEGIANIEDIIKKMLEEGQLFSPKPNVVQKV